MKTKKINIPIYQGTLILIKDKNFKKTNKKYKTKISESYGAVTFETDGDYFEYVVSFVETTSSIMAHEAVHVSNLIFKNIGVELDINNDEPQAYLIGWIVDKMEKFIKKSKK